MRPQAGAKKYSAENNSQQPIENKVEDHFAVVCSNITKRLFTTNNPELGISAPIIKIELLFFVR